MFASLAERRLDDWVASGLVSADQAAAIRAHEDATSGRVPLLLEGIGYLGVVLVLFAGGMVLAPVWEAMSDLNRIVVLVLINSGLVAGGIAVHTSDEPAAKRLREVLWLGSLVLTGTTTGWVAGGVLDWSVETVGLAIGLLTLVQAVVMHVGLREGVLTQVGAHVSLIMTVEFAIGVADSDAATMVYGIVAVVIGAAWFLAGATDRLQPPRIALVLGAITTSAGAAITFADVDSVYAATTAGLVSSFVFALLGSRLREPVLVVLGGLGMLGFGFPLLGELFGDMAGAPVVFLGLGFVILVGVIRALLRPVQPV